MHLHKLTTALKALDRHQLRRFEIYLQSPFFNVPASSVQLFDYLVSVYPQFTQNELDFKRIAEIHESLNSLNKQSKAGTVLLRHFENFLTISDLEKDDRARQMHLLKKLKELGLTYELEVQYEKSMADLSHDALQDISVFQRRHDYVDLLTNISDVKLQRNQSNDLTPAILALDEYYAIKKVRYLCEIYSRNQILGQRINVNENSTYLVDVLHPYNNEKYPFVYLFINILEMIKSSSFSNGFSHYSLLKKYILSPDIILPQKTLNECLGYIINWCLTWSNNGNKQAELEFLVWINFKMQNNLLLENGMLLPSTFRNALVLAFRNNYKSVWLKEFVEQYSGFLPDLQRDANIAFGKGLYFYQKKNYQEATNSFFQAREASDGVLAAIYYRWQFMSFYDSKTGNQQSLNIFLLDYENYLSENRVEIGYLFAYFNLFINWSKKLINQSKDKFALLRDELDNAPFFPGKDWLTQRVNVDKLG